MMWPRVGRTFVKDGQTDGQREGGGRRLLMFDQQQLLPTTRSRFAPAAAL